MGRIKSKEEKLVKRKNEHDVFIDQTLVWESYIASGIYVSDGYYVEGSQISEPFLLDPEHMDAVIIAIEESYKDKFENMLDSLLHLETKIRQD